MEIWKDVKGYEGRYFVSSIGRLKSCKKPRRNSEKILKPILVNGYHFLDLGNGKNIKRFSIHRLVAMAFLDNPENKPMVNHINGIKNDNRIENLEWCTASENQLHSIRAQLRTTVGEKNSQCKINEEVAKLIFEDKRVYREISNCYGVSIPTVSDIKRGYSWTHVTGMKNLKK